MSKDIQQISPPLVGGNEGEGGPNPDQIAFGHPSPSQRLSEPAAILFLPPSGGCVAIAIFSPRTCPESSHVILDLIQDQGLRFQGPRTI